MADKKILNNINFKPFPNLFTDRLNLRQLKLEDESEILFLRSDEMINKYIDRPKTETNEDARKFIDKINSGIENNEWIYWTISPKESDKLIGTICIWNFSDEKNIAELGFELVPEFQGKGIMQEVLIKVIEYGFENLNLKKLEAYTNQLNIPSIKLLERNKFIQEKVFEEKHSVTGESFNTVIYSLDR